jgi:hypothetical protein
MKIFILKLKLKNYKNFIEENLMILNYLKIKWNSIYIPRSIEYLALNFLI